MKKCPKGWKTITRETGLIEYVCPHGIGHPDENSAKECAEHYKEWEKPGAKEIGITKERAIKAWLSHGCDGCCQKVKER